MENTTPKPQEEKSIFTEVMTPALALKEITSWLDYKRIKPSKRVRLYENIAFLAESISYGDISIDAATFQITQKLNFPILDNNGVVAVKELKYKARISLSEVEDSAQSTAGLTTTIGAALTGQPSAIIGRLDSTDSQILSSIGVFFTS